MNGAKRIGKAGLENFEIDGGAKSNIVTFINAISQFLNLKIALVYDLFI